MCFSGKRFIAFCHWIFRTQLPRGMQEKHLSLHFARRLSLLYSEAIQCGDIRVTTTRQIPRAYLSSWSGHKREWNSLADVLCTTKGSLGADPSEPPLIAAPRVFYHHSNSVLCTCASSCHSANRRGPPLLFPSLYSPSSHGEFIFAASRRPARASPRKSKHATRRGGATLIYQTFN